MSRLSFERLLQSRPDQVRCLCGAWMLRDRNYRGKSGQAQYRCQRCNKAKVQGWSSSPCSKWRKS
jgi:predicted SprT family Zn-dependent metalloprotease